MATFIGGFEQAAETLDTSASEFDGELNSPFTLKARARIMLVRDTLRSLDASAEYGDPRLSPEGNHMNTVEKIEKAVEQAARLDAELANINSDWLVSLTQRENDTCGFARVSGDEKGIGDTFCNKPLTERLQDLMNVWQRNKEKGGMYIGAVGRIDEYRSGISADMMMRARDNFVGIHAPHLAREREAKNKIIEAARTAMTLPTRVRTAFVDPSRAAEFRNRTAKFNASELAFLAAISKRASE